MRNISIELKMIIAIIFFTFSIVSLDRYQVSNNISEQFVKSKKDKNTLLLNTIAPILALNLSLDLNDANKEYLDQIIKQNSDMEGLTLTDAHGREIYRYFKEPKKASDNDCCEIDSSFKSIIDPITGKILATAHAHFDDHEYQEMLQNNKITTLKIFAITVIFLIIFIILIKREFRFLKQLTQNVLQYDPKINNFPLVKSNRADEVGIIHNAIIIMVEKIYSYSVLLDELNQSLESKVQKRTEELQDANKKLNELAITDPLTKLSNRRHFEQSFQDIWNLAHRKGSEVALIMCDIDHFKHINDTYGHVAGDMILRDIGAILKNSLKRSMDIVARYGGEEFVIVLYDTDIDSAKQLCMNIKQNLKSRDEFTFHDIKIKSVTMSFGISSRIPLGDSTPEDLIESADIALYKAKESGRDCIVTMDK